MLSYWSLPISIIISVAWQMILTAYSKTARTTQQRIEVPQRPARRIAITSIQLMVIIVLTIATELWSTGEHIAATVPRSKALTRAWSKSWNTLEWMAEKLGNWILDNTRTKHTRVTRSRCNHGNHTRRQRGTALAMSALAMQAHATVATERRTTFDTDSETVGIDNRCSGCISHIRDDFIGDLRPSNRVVKGFAGSRTTNVQVGTLRWSWEDDLGVKHTFDIPNSYYVPDGRVRLLSPHHWTQTQTKSSQRDRCGEYTNGRECVLYWDGGKHKLHIPLGKRDNVATFNLASGFEKFSSVLL